MNVSVIPKLRSDKQVGAYVALVTAAGFTLTVFYLASLPTEAVASLLVLIVAAGVSQFMTLTLFGPSSISLSFPFTFLSLLWFGPGAAILTTAAAVLVHAVYPERRPWHKVAFNFGSLSLAAGLAGAAYVLVGGQVPPANLVDGMFPALVAVTVYFIVNSLAVSGAISITSGQSIPKVFASQHRWLSVYYGGLALGALIVATTFGRGDNLAFLFFVPALAVPWAFTRLVIARAKELLQKRRNIGQLGVLQAVGLKANSSKSLPEILGAVLKGAHDLVEADGMAIFLRTKTGQEPHLAGQLALDGRVSRNPRLAITEHDLDALPDSGEITKYAAQMSGPDVSAVYLPLIGESRALGALGLYFDKGSDLSPESMTLLGTLVQYAASAVDRQAKSQELELSRQRVFQGQETVRRQVSSSLHGPVQTRLLVVWHRLGQLETTLESRGLAEEDHASIRDFRAELLELQEYVRSLSSQLYPPIVKVGLLPAIRSLGNRFEGILNVELEIDDSLSELDRQKGAISEELRLLLYRVTEEALTNTAKHANATQGTVRGRVIEDRIEISVSDNGVGFEVERSVPGLGIRMIRDYVDAARGTVELDSRPGEGSTVTVVLPVEGFEALASEVHEAPLVAVG